MILLNILSYVCQMWYADIYIGNTQWDNWVSCTGMLVMILYVWANGVYQYLYFEIPNEIIKCYVPVCFWPWLPVYRPLRASYPVSLGQDSGQGQIDLWIVAWRYIQLGLSRWYLYMWLCVYLPLLLNNDMRGIFICICICKWMGSDLGMNMTRYGCDVFCYLIMALCKSEHLITATD